MKNRLIIFLLSLFLFIPSIKAEDKDFKNSNLKEIHKNIRNYNSHLYYPYLIKTLSEQRHDIYTERVKTSIFRIQFSRGL